MVREYGAREAYQEAEQRIEAARQKGATELNLSGIGLTELPDAIASLTQWFEQLGQHWCL